MSAQEYRQNAATCINLAQQSAEPRSVASLMAMASSWLRLAIQAEKNATNDLVYETPARPQFQTQPMQQQQGKLTDE
jgi:hypothetical protein